MLRDWAAEATFWFTRERMVKTFCRYQCSHHHSLYYFSRLLRKSERHRKGMRLRHPRGRHDLGSFDTNHAEVTQQSDTRELGTGQDPQQQQQKQLSTNKLRKKPKQWERSSMTSEAQKASRKPTKKGGKEENTASVVGVEIQTDMKHALLCELHATTL